MRKLFILFNICMLCNAVSAQTLCAPVQLKTEYTGKQLEPFEIIDTYITNDTLTIVSLSDYLYYPFDKSKDIDNINTSVKFEMQSLDNDIYLLNHKSSFLKLFLSEQTNLLEIVDAYIIDEGILLNNYISIKMPESDFFNYFGLQNDGSIRVVEMISGLDGIWQYYTFKNNALESIKIKSDYMF